MSDTRVNALQILLDFCSVARQLRAQYGSQRVHIITTNRAQQRACFLLHLSSEEALSLMLKDDATLDITYTEALPAELKIHHQVRKKITIFHARPNLLRTNMIVA
jgi:hypothetical protein